MFFIIEHHENERGNVGELYGTENHVPSSGKDWLESDRVSPKM